jgi:hypothetical protein
MTDDDRKLSSHLFGMPVLKGPDGRTYIVNPELMKPAKFTASIGEVDITDDLTAYKVKFNYYDLRPFTAGLYKINGLMMDVASTMRTMSTVMTFTMRPLRHRVPRPRNHHPHRRPHRSRRLRK